MRIPILRCALVGALMCTACDDDAEPSPMADACVIVEADATIDAGADADEPTVDAGRDADAVDASVEDAAMTDAAADGATGGDGGVDAAPTCDDDGGVEVPPFEFTDMELAMLDTLSPLPAVPSDPTNMYADDEDAAALGQAFFFDERFSGPITTVSGNDLGATGETDRISCASCHNGAYMDDQRTPLPRRVSLGANFHSRNAPTVINSVFYKWTNWGGRFSAPWELPIAVVESPVIMNGSRLEVAHIIYDHYRSEYEAVFGPLDDVIATLPASGKPNAMTPGAWEMVLTDNDRAIVNRVLINFGKAIEAYERLIVSRNAPFDQLVAGDDDAVEDAAKRGARLFLGKARCVNCHNGPLLSDNKFHNLGVPQGVMGSQLAMEHVPAVDNGRFNDVPLLYNSPFSTNTTASDNTMTGRFAGLTNPASEEDRGAFRTPGLRGVTLTAPYMHSGQLDTLEEVIDFYDEGGIGFGGGASGVRDPLLVPLHLTDEEKADLLAFLSTLNGDDLPANLLVDPSP